MDLRNSDLRLILLNKPKFRQEVCEGIAEQ